MTSHVRKSQRFVGIWVWAAVGWALMSARPTMAGLEPDPWDDGSPTQCNKRCPCPPGCFGQQCGGKNLHVKSSNGNVWTEVPVLTAYGAGDESLELSLFYNSVDFSHYLVRTYAIPRLIELNPTRGSGPKLQEFDFAPVSWGSCSRENG